MNDLPAEYPCIFYGCLKSLLHQHGCFLPSSWPSSTNPTQTPPISNLNHFIMSNQNVKPNRSPIQKTYIIISRLLYQTRLIKLAHLQVSFFHQQSILVLQLLQRILNVTTTKTPFLPQLYRFHMWLLVLLDTNDGHKENMAAELWLHEPNPFFMIK